MLVFHWKFLYLHSSEILACIFYFLGVFSAWLIGITFSPFYLETVFWIPSATYRAPLGYSTSFLYSAVFLRTPHLALLWFGKDLQYESSKITGNKTSLEPRGSDFHRKLYYVGRLSLIYPSVETSTKLLKISLIVTIYHLIQWLVWLVASKVLPQDLCLLLFMFL